MMDLARISKGKIVIELNIANLAHEAVVPDCLCDGEFRPSVKIVNARKFARDFVAELNREEEDGSTPVHALFDAAFVAAVEQGADGMECLHYPDSGE